MLEVWILYLSVFRIVVLMALSLGIKTHNMAQDHAHSIVFLIFYLAVNELYCEAHSSKISRMRCRNEAIFKASGTDFILKENSPNLISTTHAPLLPDCARSCIKANECKSMIYKKEPAKRGEKNCQMLKNERQNLTNSDFESSLGWIYYQPLQQGTSRCPPNICALGYKCVENCTSNTYNCTALCENGWISDGSYCYYYSNASLSWSSARIECQRFGADLVTIKNYTQSAFILSKVSGSYWIGATDAAVEGSFKWVDGALLSYTMWCSGEPNDVSSNENCAEVRTCGWNDVSCSMSRRYICQKNFIDAAL